MLSVALVEDEERWIKEFRGHLQKFCLEKKETFEMDVFRDGTSFLDEYQFKYDLVFMDIAMPHMNGLDVATRLRKIDSDVPLIFLTNLAQYAIKGYEVNAIDFLVKPLSYELFCIRMEKLLSHIKKRKTTSFTVRTATSTRMIPFLDILYVESVKHYIFFHTKSEVLKMRLSLGEIKDAFKKNGFSEINRSILVNLAYVEGYNGNEVTLAKEILPLSRVYKAQFLNDLTSYIGSGGEKDS